MSLIRDPRGTWGRREYTLLKESFTGNLLQLYAWEKSWEAKNGGVIVSGPSSNCSFLMSIRNSCLSAQATVHSGLSEIVIFVRVRKRPSSTYWHQISPTIWDFDHRYENGRFSLFVFYTFESLFSAVYLTFGWSWKHITSGAIHDVNFQQFLVKLSYGSNGTVSQLSYME